MKPRSVMKERCTIWRDESLGTEDPWGRTETAEQAAYEDLPCQLANRIIPNTGVTVAADRDFVLHEYQMIVPRYVEVTEQDWVRGVTDRVGRVKTDSRMDIKAVIPRAHYTLLMLQEVR